MKIILEEGKSVAKTHLVIDPIGPDQVSFHRFLPDMTSMNFTQKRRVKVEIIDLAD